MKVEGPRREALRVDIAPMPHGANPIRWVSNVLLRGWAWTFGYDVFISYARDDGLLLARQINGELDRRYLVFRDEEGIDRGERFGDRIDRELRRAGCLVVLLSARALVSPWVKRECATFLRLRGGRARVVPVFIEPVSPANLPPDWKWIAEWHGAILDARALSAVRTDPAWFASPHGPDTTASPLATPDAVVHVGGVAREAFRGPRQRMLARAAAATSLALFAGLGLFAERTARFERLRAGHMQEATAAAGQLAYDHAALELVRAIDAAGDDDEARRALAVAGRRIVLRPCALLAVPPAFGVLAVAGAADQPRFLLHDVENESSDRGRVVLADAEGWLLRIAAPGESQPQVVVDRNVAYVAAAGSVHRVILDDPQARVTAALTELESGRIEGMLDSVEMAVNEHGVVLLGRSVRPRRILVLDPETLVIRAEHVIEEEDNFDTLVTLSRSRNHLAFVVRREAGTFEQHLRTEWMDTHGELQPAKDFALAELQRSHLGSIFTLWSIALAPDDAQAFVALDEFNFAGAPESRAGGVRWMALDLQFPRQLLMEPGIARVEPLQAVRSFEAVYLRDSGELRALQCRSLVVLDRPGVTIAPRAIAWALAPEPIPGRSFRAFVATREDLTVYDDVTPVFRVRWPEIVRTSLAAGGTSEPEPYRLLVSADGRFVVLVCGMADGTDVLVVWRHEPAGLDVDTIEPSAWERRLLEWQRTSLPGLPD